MEGHRVGPTQPRAPQSVQDIDVAQSSTEVDLDDLIPTAVEGSDTDSVADALEPDVVVDADLGQRNGDEDVMSEAGVQSRGTRQVDCAPGTSVA